MNDSSPPSPDDSPLARLQAERDALAKAASHDLRQPLRSILHSLELLERRHLDELSPPARDLLARALDATRTGHAMIDAMLEYARVSTRAEPMTTVALADLVARVERDLRAKLDETHATIEYADLPEVVADRRQLLAMIRHLVDNAIQAAGDAPPRIAIAANDRGDAGWEITVHDQGIGLPSGAEARVFDLFRTFPPPGKAAGLGMGLAICRQIAARHGGEITAESTPDGGTTLRFLLPRHTAESSASVTVRTSTDA